MMVVGVVGLCLIMKVIIVSSMVRLIRVMVVMWVNLSMELFLKY